MQTTEDGGQRTDGGGQRTDGGGRTKQVRCVSVCIAARGSGAAVSESRRTRMIALTGSAKSLTRSKSAVDINLGISFARWRHMDC